MARSFTISATRRLQEIVSDCRVSDPLWSGEGEGRAPEAPFRGLWDTGATASVIAQAVVNTCRLKPVGMTKVFTSNGLHICEQYLINLHLPNGLQFSNLRASKQLLAGADVLIGMDVIGSGDFAITNPHGRTTFSFRFPSTGAIDFARPNS